MQKQISPVLLIAVLIVISAGMVNICQVYLRKDVFPVSKMWTGSDYHAIYFATQRIMRGESPYASKRYGYPPVAAYLNYPLGYVDEKTAANIIFFLLIASVLAAYGIMHLTFAGKIQSAPSAVLLWGLVIILFSSPFYFLIHRGHMVGFIMLLLALGFYLMGKSRSASGICFGLSIGIILFPFLIVIPLLLYRKYRVVSYALLTLLCLFLIWPDLWLCMLQTHLLERLGAWGWLTFYDTCGLATFAIYCTLIVNKIFGISGSAGVSEVISNFYYYEMALAVYGLLFFTMVYTDYRIKKKQPALDVKIEIMLMLMYVPFMAAVPKIVYNYTLTIVVLLIPGLCYFTDTLKKQLPKAIVLLFVVGIALTQFQAPVLQKLLETKHYLIYFFPALGLFIVMVGCVVFKIWFVRSIVELPEM